MRNPEARSCLAILLVVYALIYGGMLYAGGLKPYVMDNNESYSSLNHARNLIEFGPVESAGLADEAVSPSPDAHPMVHTHQGNVPRLFAAVLHLAGLRSIESQIAVTTFTAGLAAVVMAFWFLTACAGPRYALLACLVLITDYAYFAQWQINTYRVWIPFFIFSSLLTAELYAQTRKVRWLLPVFLNSLFLFYYEFAFVSFTATMTGFYMGWRLRDDWRRLLAGWIVLGLGGAVSLTILFMQVVGYLGWQDALTDARLTFFARNFAGAETADLATLQSFYETRDIAFFYNVAANRYDDVLTNFWPSFVGRQLQVLTPFIAFMTFAALSGFGVRSAVTWASKRWNASPAVARYRHVLAMAAAGLAGLFLFQVFWLSELWSARSAFPSTGGQLTAAAGTALAVVLGVAAMRVVTGWFATAANSGDAAIRVAGCALFLLGLVLWGVVETGFYDPLTRVLWLEAAAPPGRFVWQSAALLAVVAVWSMAILLPPRPHAPHETHERLYAFFGSGAAAVFIMGTLFPGYVWSGYLDRDETVLAPHWAALLAFAALVTFRQISDFSGRARILSSAAANCGLVRRYVSAMGLTGGLGAFALVVAALHWVWAQGTYALLVPPTQFNWIGVLSREPFKGHSVVSNNYAVPYGLMTGGWAYTDTRFATGGYEQAASGFEPVHSNRGVWLADARTNRAYRRPALFVCFIGNSLKRAAQRLEGRGVPGCRDLGLVREAGATYWRPFEHEIAAIDSKESDAWAIIRLDWTAPPFLRNTEAGSPGRYVDVDIATRPGGARSARVDYDYAHQEGEREGASIIRVYRLASKDGSCSTPQWMPNDLTDLKPAIEVRGTKTLALPRSMKGPIVISVRPVSARRTGREYFSDVINLGGSNGGC